MILPDLVLPSRSNQRWQYSGLDSPDHCLDKKHFQSYPYPIEYCYNSRGFRDTEWPESRRELQEAIWCVGDSFTVGLGQPFAHIWPQVLQATSGQRCINISLDGASNDWICRRAIDIMHCINPAHMVVMWSYTHRRESHRTDLPDDQRLIAMSKDSVEQDYMRWVGLSSKLHMSAPRIVQITIPDFHPSHDKPEAWWDAIRGHNWPACPQTVSELERLPEFIQDEMKTLHKCYTQFKQLLSTMEKKAEIPNSILGVLHISQQLDWARDHHHFDYMTSQWVVDQILPRIVS